MPTTKRSDTGKVEKMFYRRDEAAFAFGVGVGQIDDLISNKKVRTRRWGRCVLIPAGDLKKIEAEIMLSDLLDAKPAK